MTQILILNVGSSTLKFSCYEITRRRNGAIQVVEGSEKERLEQFTTQVAKLTGISAVLHRVVHAGSVRQCVARMSGDVVASIRHWSHLAPLHNGMTLELIDALAEIMPQVSQYAVFDSGLYAHLPEIARCYALPADLDNEWPVARYGFHGLAHLSQWNQLQPSDRRRVVTIQLGSGCSMTAWHEGQPVDTSMGFSPVEGLTMATRSGSLDPMIILHLLEKGSASVESLATLLQREAGMKGLSGDSGDVRTLLKKNDAKSKLAIDHFCYQARKQLGAYCFALGGVDSISFGGGVAENQPLVRERILSGLEQFGIALCPDRNEVVRKQQTLHTGSSKVALFLNPVDEMTVMADQFLEFQDK